MTVTQVQPMHGTRKRSQVREALRCWWMTFAISLLEDGIRQLLWCFGVYLDHKDVNQSFSLGIISFVLQPTCWSCETSRLASSDCRCKQTFLSSMYSKGVRSKKVKRRNLAFVQRLLIDPLLPTKILYFSRVLAYSALRLTATMEPNPF